jgi:hypothetical protein
MIKIIVKTLIIFYRISNKDFKEKEKERTNREGYKRVWLDRAKNNDERAKENFYLLERQLNAMSNRE